MGIQLLVLGQFATETPILHTNHKNPSHALANTKDGRGMVKLQADPQLRIEPRRACRLYTLI